MNHMGTSILYVLTLQKIDYDCFQKLILNVFQNSQNSLIISLLILV